MEHELWFTAILNKILGGPVAALLVSLNHPAADAAHPIPNYIAMEILVFVLILVGAILLRRQLSVESPGKFQHIMETVVEFIRDMNEEIIGHGSSRYLAMIGTFGIFIGVCNILGTDSDAANTNRAYRGHARLRCRGISLLQLSGNPAPRDSGVSEAFLRTGHDDGHHHVSH